MPALHKMTTSAQEKWVLVTGASSGIGRALALEFAGGGFNVFLTARDENALNEVAEKCRGKGVRTEVLAADLSRPESTGALIGTISGRRFDVLVNSAGFGVKGDFAETDLGDELEMLGVQLAAMLKLTKAALPRMIAHGSGRILNVASVYSFSPVPKQAVYSACKSFIFSFSSSLRAELKNSGVSVTVLCPGITQTQFRTRAGIADKKDLSMTAEAVASVAFKQTMRGTRVVVPGFQNKLFVFLSRHLPFRSQMALINFINERRGVNNK